MTRSLALAALIPAAALLSAPLCAGTLPAPYVSRALDAVLIPVTADTISAFGLGAQETGVLVLATAPGGVADAAGVAPGDVISTVHGEGVADPIRLDEVVYYWLTQGVFDFGLDAWREGAPVSYTTVVTMEEWTSVVDITTVETWSSYTTESFDYAEYTAEYSEEMTASYESSEATIEETASSDSFAAEVAEDEAADAATDDSGDAAAAEDGADDAAMADDGGDEAATDRDVNGDEGAADEGVDEGADEGGDTSGDADGDDTTGSDE